MKVHCQIFEVKNSILLTLKFSVGSTKVPRLKDLQFTYFQVAQIHFSVHQVNVKLSFGLNLLVYG